MGTMLSSFGHPNSKLEVKKKDGKEDTELAKQKEWESENVGKLEKSMNLEVWVFITPTFSFLSVNT